MASTLPAPAGQEEDRRERQQILGDLLNHDTVNMVLRERRNTSGGGTPTPRSTNLRFDNRLDEHPSIAEFDEWRQHTVRELKNLQESQAKLEAKLEDKVAYLEAELERKTVVGRTRPSNTTGVSTSRGGDPTNFATVEALPDDDGTRVWQAQESMWDAALFLGDHRLTTSDNLVISFLLSCTLFIQLVFIFVLFTEYNNPLRGELSDIKDAVFDMRNSIGNHVRYRDAITGAPLVELLCADTGANVEVGVASDMRELLVEIDRYLKVGGWDVYPGPILAICALTCYFAALVQELRDLMLMPSAVRALLLEREKLAPDVVHSRRRLPIAFLVSTLRFVILLWLTYCGTIFIANTLEKRELVLNAVALVFVIEVDEILFLGALHHNVKCLVTQLRPVRIKHHKFSEYFDMPFFVTMLGCLGVWVAVGLSIVPLVLDAKDVVDMICNGRRDFVYATDTKGVLVWSEVTQEKSGYLVAAVKELRDSANGFTNTMLGQHVATARQVSLADVGTQVFNSRSCFEDVRLNETRQRFVLESDFGFAVASCDVLQQHCDRDDEPGLRVRQACPHTCGCDAPITKPLFYRDPEAGCGYGCYGSAEWHGWRERAPCEDAPPTTPEWQGYLTALEQQAAMMAVEGSGGAQDTFQKLHDGLTRDGCAYAQKERFCETANEAALMFLLCPATCGCPQRDPDGCPTSCLATPDPA